MDERDRIEALRRAAANDVAELVVLLNRKPWPPHCLQMIGDGLLAASRSAIDGVDRLSRDCAAELTERGWDGDDELAARLDAASGTGATATLRPLPVDLEDLSMVLEGDPTRGGGWIELRTGEVWPEEALEYDKEFDRDELDDPDHWMRVDCEGSRAGYRDMERFIAQMDDRSLADQLSRAIEGRGPFRRFHGAIWNDADQLTAWNCYSNDRRRGRARRWLAAEGFTPDA